MTEENQILVITAIKEEVPGVELFTLEPVSEVPITYQAGQYLTVLYPKNKDIRRSYSITSAPALSEPLTIGVKRIANGLFSRYLFDTAQPGDTLETTGVGGFFILPDNLTVYKQLFFLAAGSGITPIYSLLKEVLISYPHLSIVLIYSNQSEQETLFFTALTELAKEHPERLRIEFLFSNNPNLLKARLRRDLLVQMVHTYKTCPPAQILAYVCGPQDYMRMCIYGLQGAGLPANNIRKEIFNTSIAVPQILPPNTEVHQVSIVLRQEEISFPVQYPTTILQAARKSGLRLPFSCEAGYCGNCVAQCVSGKVWMTKNEVLTQKDLDQGLVLTCVGYPLTGVTLKI